MFPGPHLTSLAVKEEDQAKRPCRALRQACMLPAEVSSCCPSAPETQTQPAWGCLVQLMPPHARSRLFASC